MYPRLFGDVVIASGDYDEAVDVQYGDEGLGLAQAQRLKRKMLRSGKRLQVGRTPFTVVGGQGYRYTGLGLAPLAVAAAAKTAGIKISLKKGRPRMFGGPLVDTVNDVRARVERGDMAALQRMDVDRKSAKDKSAWQRIWREVLPTWRYNVAQYNFIRSVDATFPGSPPSPSLATEVKPQAPGTPAISVQSPVDATGAPVPTSILIQQPQSPVASGGAAPTASEQTAAAAQPTFDVEAGPTGVEQFKISPTMLLIGGVVAFMALQGGSKRRRR